ncbi:guanosine-5'-triphosphate,3'-diphosphate diphosphatase [Pseudoalteromonas fuliginea]|uniref:Guanosine-5'-triphosphate,3'-diphosphate pyrophosphatase n=1 Tax=Pseudoalteromonas fuliginea TaxID=1872678 RepID=A0AB73BJW0_9GAMM|nr:MULTISPECIES: guanosine-5'-triphosphate,3'-diphosphate diphosphatase [Pseudoalteromonas]ALQ06725.1 guanosine-3',5'-bis(diphosphate) 3'-pyrophosphohydrolase [Pseudoalteromonas sp. Bsw20308]ATG79018.1 guanosine-3',5'-bis(diphosphate) 3'-pyrophosphohydrolase [Pseudoalteromonas sp. 1_2015MBL_MicDiv]KAA1162686.1 guanosine-5'-triphosphate,3'-diphosphate diphosphatase [Pseudoalteromonas fuliginea]KDC52045.1 guanosine-3',5'-bis(diphosphate) 3'-pyrophosphohydrolase [Pseudoalteromonas fuliginea]KJZ25
MGQLKPQKNVYAVIDLGSNSFHMLIVKSIAGGLQTIGRVKRKVRLAAGLDTKNVLSSEAMQRGWECLALFAERLQDIPKKNITIVATATLRLATNADVFKIKAEKILGHNINVISGEVEARTIYKGVAHTSSCTGKQLVIDIGGASTEVVIGKGFEALHYKSLNMGCVTYLERYFKDCQLSDSNFNTAIKAARTVIDEISPEYKAASWKVASGASGTVQAIQEIMVAQNLDDLLTLEKLNTIKNQAIAFSTIAALDLPGLSEDRRLVFVSGLAILIALFESLEIESMGLAGGALREGVLYSMVPELHNNNIRKRTVDGFMSRYHVDQKQACRVSGLAVQLAANINKDWPIESLNGLPLLKAVAQLHEVGLLIEYKQYHKHTAYILENTDMPGFSQSEHKLIVAVADAHRSDFPKDCFNSLGINSLLAQYIVRLLRIAVILSMRRQDDVVPHFELTAKNEVLDLKFERNWLKDHPLMASELQQESKQQGKLGWKFIVN